MANPFKAMKNANRAQAKILRRDTASDFRVTQGGLDAIMANLTTTQTGLGRKLTRVNARGLAAMERMSTRSDKRMDKIVSTGQNVIDKRFGSVIGQDPNLLKGTARLASSQAKVNKGQVKAGELQMRGANEAMDILAGAAQTAADAGQYELAMALRERSEADAETIAASKLALQQQKLDAKLNERYLRLQTQLQSGGSGGAGLEGALAEVGALAEAGTLQDADIARLALQYNLGPEAVKKLRDIAGQYGSSAAALTSAKVFTEENGQSPAAVLPAKYETAINAQVWKKFDPSAPMPDVNTAVSILGWSLDASTGKYVDRAGTEIDDLMVQAGVAYVQSTWARISGAATADAPSRAHPGTVQ